MEKQLEVTGYREILLSIPGIGIVSATSFLGEIVILKDLVVQNK
ncbi:hypothetical protein [Cetobacterium sp.]